VVFKTTERAALPPRGSLVRAAARLPCCDRRLSFPVSVTVVEYRYELRRGDEVVATGHLQRERLLEVGERLEIGGQLGIVRAIEPLLGE
jgi:hypothetical protein